MMRGVPRRVLDIALSWRRRMMPAQWLNIPGATRPSPQSIRLAGGVGSEISQAARIVRSGGIIAFPFNGVFGLFGDCDLPKATDLIIEAKNRPQDKKLILVSPPEFAHEFADLSHLKHRRAALLHVWAKVHALGVILPAAESAPHHLVSEAQTVLVIWTEYPPLRALITEVRKLGGRGLVGTSANKAGQPTHWRYADLCDEFDGNVHALVHGDFTHLPDVRRRSTTVVDFTNVHPRLHREGNVPELELRPVLEEHGFHDLFLGRDVIAVRGRS
jgi:L-threonylcarbamoyladenylate synthase